MQNLGDLQAIPIRSRKRTESRPAWMPSATSATSAPTEVDHYQLRRVIDVYVSPHGEDLGAWPTAIEKIVDETPICPRACASTARHGPRHARLLQKLRLGLILSVILVYLILVAQFQSFIDPFFILLAVPTG